LPVHYEAGRIGPDSEAKARRYFNVNITPVRPDLPVQPEGSNENNFVVLAFTEARAKLFPE
jgi:hypothetical protein